MIANHPWLTIAGKPLLLPSEQPQLNDVIRLIESFVRISGAISKRFVAGGIKGLRDRPRLGKPPQHSATEFRDWLLMQFE